MNNSSSAICLLCVKPDKIHIDFFNSIINYEIFMLCDDNNCNTNLLDNTKIKIIKICDKESYKNGFKNSNSCVDKNPSAWDKVFYYFSKINLNYDYVWILEDDVFVPNNDIFMNLDKIYGHSDLLSKSNINYIVNNKDSYLWSSATNKYELPWFKSMVCCCRISKQLFQEIRKYVEEKSELFFIETMINTIAYHKKLVIKEVKEFENINPKPQRGNRYRKIFNGNPIWMTKSIIDLKKNYMQHPVKNLELHEQFRIT